jgi:hypothetical protein
VAALGSIGNGGVVHVVGSALLNILASLFIFAIHLISIESLLAIGLSAGLTVCESRWGPTRSWFHSRQLKYVTQTCHSTLTQISIPYPCPGIIFSPDAYNVTNDDPTFDGGIMQWVLLSFAVITPLSAAIGMAFNRREAALIQISEFKATVLNLYSAHVCWDWSLASKSGPSGRAASSVVWLDNADKVLNALFQLCNELTRLLTLPTANRARHLVFSHGRRQREEIACVARKLHRSMLAEISILSYNVELLKHEGLPGNEAARIRQWERGICTAIEKLLVLKKYRTPQALRSFGRLFTVFLTPFYAPYFGQMATDLHSLGMASK